MTPQEKANELVSEMCGNNCTEKNINKCKKLSLIVVNEILPIVEGYEDALSISQQSDYLEYWEEVKNEINKL